LSVILGVGVNLITPYIGDILGKMSHSVRERNTREKEIFDKSVQYLIDHPLVEINLRIERVGIYLVGAIFLPVALILSIDQSLRALIISIVSYLIFMFCLISARKRSRLLRAVTEIRKQSHPDIDVG
jgi:hypothetical protein